jgi:hypothetical protein
VQVGALDREPGGYYDDNKSGMEKLSGIFRVCLMHLVAFEEN